MANDMDREIPLLAPENLPLDLGDLGIITEAKLVMPGVYEAALENPETAIGTEVYIVQKNAAEISSAAKGYGKAVPDYPELLAYSEDATGNTMYIIGYELFRYKILNHLPLPEDETIRSIAAIGAEMHPGYFGGYPVPFLTPWGCTTRNKIIANGLFWIETEQCQQGLAVACPKYDDLSDGARGLAEQFDDGSVHTNGEMPGYLFFREVNSSVPLFELICLGPSEKLINSINLAALMNAIYQFHPEYAVQHNAAEQVGANDGFRQLLHMLNIDVEPKISHERLISLTAQTGTEFIDF